MVLCCCWPVYEGEIGRKWSPVIILYTETVHGVVLTYCVVLAIM